MPQFGCDKPHQPEAVDVNVATARRYFSFKSKPFFSTYATLFVKIFAKWCLWRILLRHLLHCNWRRKCIKLFARLPRSFLIFLSISYFPLYFSFIIQQLPLINNLKTWARNAPFFPSFFSLSLRKYVLRARVLIRDLNDYLTRLHAIPMSIWAFRSAGYLSHFYIHRSRVFYFTTSLCWNPHCNM